VDVADADTLPTGWKRNADFLITIVNQKDPKKNIAKGSSNISIGKSFMEDSTGQLSQRRVFFVTDFFFFDHLKLSPTASQPPHLLKLVDLDPLTSVYHNI
jgi:hypothetical protein